MVFVAAFVVGTMTVDFDSGFQAWLPTLATDEAAGGGQQPPPVHAQPAAWTVGPPLAGFLATVQGGFRLAFGLNATTFLISALVTLLVLVEVRPRPAPGREPVAGLLSPGHLLSVAPARTCG